MRYLVLIILLFKNSGTIYQEEDRSAPRKENRINSTGEALVHMEVSFAGLTEGEISIADHLADSLEFVDPAANLNFRVKSFHLTIMCKGQVLRSMENESGNKFTDEMIQAIRQAHSGCTITFGGIKLISLWKDRDGKFATTEVRNLKLVLK